MLELKIPKKQARHLPWLAGHRVINGQVSVMRVPVNRYQQAFSYAAHLKNAYGITKFSIVPA